MSSVGAGHAEVAAEARGRFVVEAPDPVDALQVQRVLPRGRLDPRTERALPGCSHYEPKWDGYLH